MPSFLIHYLHQNGQGTAVFETTRDAVTIETINKWEEMLAEDPRTGGKASVAAFTRLGDMRDDI